MVLESRSESVSRLEDSSDSILVFKVEISEVEFDVEVRRFSSSVSTDALAVSAH